MPNIPHTRFSTDREPWRFEDSASLTAAFSARAREPMRRAWELASHILGGAPMEVEVLAESFRAIVLRCRTRESSVVAKHFRRRDSATNASGFGFLRARHGAEVLPHVARLLAVDEVARMLIFEDVGSGDPVTKGPLSFRSWLHSWPTLCRDADSTLGRAFRNSIAASDPESARRGTSGALPSLGLLRRRGIPESEIRRLIEPERSVLWCGDMNPSNFVRHRERGILQIDTEGTGYCDPALLVAEVRGRLPSALNRDRFLGLLTPQEWDEAADHLAGHWHVTSRDEEIARRCLDAISHELR